MSSYIHGFRVWNFSRCSRTKEIVLRGSAGQHLHNRVQKAAECEGISHALWLTETAQKRLEENYGKKAHEGPSPDWDCSCLTAETPVLMADLTWRPVGDIKVGEIVLAFDEEPRPHKQHRHFQRSRVTKTFLRPAQVVRLRLEDGTSVHITPDHLVLAHSPGRHNPRWLPVNQLQPGWMVYKPVNVWYHEDSHEAGWVAGMYDGEGSISPQGHASLRGDKVLNRLLFAQKPGPEMDRVRAFLEERDYQVVQRAQNRCDSLLINGGRGEHLRFLGTIRPERLLRKLQEWPVWGSMGGRKIRVEEVSPVPQQEMVCNLQTTAGTFIAAGLAVHNCGAYFFRRLEDAPQAPTNAQAHVTCLERTILHQDGGRTTQYSVDYFLAPKEANIQVFVPVIDTVKAQDQNADVAYSTPAGNLRYGFGVAYPFMLPGEALPYMEVLEEVSASLGVPILDRRDLKGCPVCLEVNGWRKPIEIDEIMMREWFGAGYEQHEKDEAWGDALDAEVSD
ncbi:hypothetical protein LCGC14_0532190 [marine sediment metagenome]|uniref:Hint domain-containing protein n=1 Tax=marine sediment metagenome TaxID=412755 RepID=A0A0F9RVB0_9ZZZZ